MPTSTFAQRVIKFNKILKFNGMLPNGFKVLNPYIENPETMEVMKQFYTKYYNDSNNRKFIIGINPSRHGAGITGVPFTDTKRLFTECGIEMTSAHTHEVSSVFMYDMIEAWGGVQKFYSEFYINSPFPLAIVRQNKSSQWLNANYYDDAVLFTNVTNFMIDSLKGHISMGLYTDIVYVLGIKNATFIHQLNKKVPLFKNIIVLEHPRFIQQYKLKDKSFYIDKYLTLLSTKYKIK